MQHYTVFHPFALSFFSKPLYQFVGRSWKGTGFVYLLLLLAIVWVPVLIATHARIAAVVDREAPKFLNQLPTITIKNGSVSLDAPMPYTIIDPQSGVQIMVIDTTGAITSLDQTPALALLTKTSFMIKQKQRREVRTFDLSEIQDFTISRERATGWVRLFRNWFAVVVYPFAVIGSYAYRILQALLYALIGLLFVKMSKASLDYLVVLQISLVAVTPAIVLNAALKVLAIHIPFWGFFAFLIAMGYLFFAVRVNAGTAGPGTP